MIKFVCQPFNTVIVHYIYRITLNEFIYVRSIGAEDGGVTAPLWWANGVVFEHTAMEMTDDIVNEQLKGIIHWALLIYAHMPEYRKELEGPRKVQIPIVKNDDIIFSEMAICLKETYEKST